MYVVIKLVDIAVYALVNYATLFLLAGLSYGLGQALSRRYKYLSVSERIAFRTSLGLGVMSYIVLAAGLLHLLYPAVMLGVLALIGILCVLMFKDSWRNPLTPLLEDSVSRSWFVASSIILVFLIPVLVFPLYPPMAGDATSYHLAAAKIYSQSQQLQPTPYLMFPVFPQTNEMLFALMLSIHDRSAQLIQYMMMILVAVALYAWGSQALSPRAGVWAAALWLGNPMVLWLGGSGYIDIGLTLFITMSAYAFWRWLQTQEWQWNILAATFCGFGLGSKYTALFFLGFLSTLAAYHSILRRKPAACFLFIGIALAVASPWYLRNYYYTGDPVFPFFPELFGYSLWTKPDLQLVLGDLRSYGVDRTILAMLLLPWYFVSRQAAFHIEAPISPIYGLAAPLVLIIGSRNGLSSYLLKITLCYTLLWFFYGQILRYWLPVVPLLSLVIAGTLDNLVRWLPFKGTRIIRAILIISGIALFISPAWSYALKTILAHGGVPVNEEQRNLYLRRHLTTYPAYEYINNLRGKNYVLYALYDEDSAFFANGIFMGEWVGPARYGSIRSKLGDSKALYLQLKALGATHFLVNLHRENVPKVSLPEDQFFHSHFKLIYARAFVLLFELAEQPLNHIMGRELMRNPGFEDLKNHEPIGWDHEGRPLLNESGQYSHSGRVAVLSKGFRNVFIQAVPVEARRLYLLEEYVRATEPGQRARLQINWKDVEGRLVGADIIVVDVGAYWRNYHMQVTAPERAAFAVVYASSHGRSVVWFDDLSLKEVTYKYGEVTTPANETSLALDQSSALLKAASRYLSSGFALTELTPLRVEALGLLPKNLAPTGLQTGNWTLNGLWLGPWGSPLDKRLAPEDLIGVGIVGSYAALEPVIRRYSAYSIDIYFPYPQRFTEGSKDRQGELLMIFTRAGVTRAAEAR